MLDLILYIEGQKKIYFFNKRIFVVQKPKFKNKEWSFKRKMCAFFFSFSKV